MKVLSFDISSTCIGYSVLEFCKINNAYSLIKSGYFIPKSKSKDVFDDLLIIKQNVINLINMYAPDVISIEDFIKYMKGKSSANTITKLAIYNRYLGMCCFEQTNKKPIIINVLSIRHFVKKCLNLNKIPKKEEVPDCLEKIIKFKFPWIFKKNKKISYNYDVGDAIACGLCCLGKINDNKY